MCTEACPCVYANYEEGLWDDIPADVLADFGRTTRMNGDNSDDLTPLTTDEDVPSFDNLSLETQAMLAEAGIGPDDELPPVSTYVECFDTII